MGSEIVVIGAGLAGSEAAWALASRGHRVRLVEMRPNKQTPAHQTPFAAEMVCSNSLKSEDPHSASGILKAEMERMDSLVLRIARTCRVPAGNSLAVDRDLFSIRITRELLSHPNIRWDSVESCEIAPDQPTILATGPLTSESMANWLSDHCGHSALHFYDAIAPILLSESLDLSIAFPGSRYDKGTPDFINCPLTPQEYDRFLDALLAAPRVPLHDGEAKYFEACLPIEVMADRGRETLRFGPMKPMGLTDPRTGRWPYAAVQLRRDTLAGEHYNMVGFQTRLKWPAQAEVFRMIPGLEGAQFARFGSIHRNTYVDAPKVLDATLRAKNIPNLRIAGQLSGVEGYLESAACGLAAALFTARDLEGSPVFPLPRETMLGAMLHYLEHCPSSQFAPVNAMLGLLPAPPKEAFDHRQARKEGGSRGIKVAKGMWHRARALGELEWYLSGSK